MFVELPKAAIETAEPDPNLTVVLLICLSGLTLSFLLLHLFPLAMADAMLLLAFAG
jgi:hypothetical protein